MTKLATYSTKGVKKTSVSLPKSMSVDVNMKLLAQAIRVYEDNAHPGLSKVKTRGEVKASKRKIYRQKGTGGARHGARSAPIFVGGGVAHGPKGVKRKLTLPKKMRKKALNIALSAKVREGELIVVDNFSSLKKTKEVALMLGKIVRKEKGFDIGSRFTIALSEKNKNASLAIRNLANVEVVPFKNLNAYNVFLAGILIIDREAIGEQKNLKTEKPSTKTLKTHKSAKKQKVIQKHKK